MRPTLTQRDPLPRALGEVGYQQLIARSIATEARRTCDDRVPVPRRSQAGRSDTRRTTIVFGLLALSAATLAIGLGFQSLVFMLTGWSAFMAAFGVDALYGRRARRGPREWRPALPSAASRNGRGVDLPLQIETGRHRRNDADRRIGGHRSRQ